MKTPLFKVGDSVMSDPNGSDVKLMKRNWRAVVSERTKMETGQYGPKSDGYYYVTVGYWDGKSREVNPTSRPLHSENIVADTTNSVTLNNI